MVSQVTGTKHFFMPYGLLLTHSIIDIHMLLDYLVMCCIHSSRSAITEKILWDDKYKWSVILISTL